MQFFSHEGHENVLIMNEPLSTIDVDPLPYFSQNQPQYVHEEQQPQAILSPVVSKDLRAPNGSGIQSQTQYSLLQHSNHAATRITNNNLARSASALSIDWEVYELFNEFVSGGGVDENEALMMGGPIDDFPQNHSGNAAGVNPVLPGPDYRASQQHLQGQPEQVKGSHDFLEV